MIHTIVYASASHPLGMLLVGATEKGICYLGLGKEASIARRFPNATLKHAPQALAPLLTRIFTVIDGLASASSLPLDMQGTPFQRMVWQQLLAIPYGETRSYIAIARTLGKPNAARAVGTACGANPVALIVPCHRVTASDGGLGGFAYGLKAKKRLLAWEAERVPHRKAA